jgi:putative chitinase
MADSFEFDFTQDKLAQILQGNPYVDHWFEALSKILPDYDINTVPRVAAFLAQTAHESGGYRALTENLNYRAETLSKVWPSKFPPDVAQQYAHNPEAIANRAYASRMGNGDEASGDGFRYCGRGLIQLTGKANYTAFAQSIDTPVEEIPEFLGTFEGAIQSACWFWENNNLNSVADAGDLVHMTKIINGGTLGLDDRTARFQHACQVLQA